MLSEKATQLTIALCHKIEGTAFVIYSWNDIFDSLGDIKPETDEECKNLFEEVRLNSCLTLKYKDEDQACFAMTDKARLLTQELDAMAHKERIKEPMIKTDDSGNSMLVLPTTNSILKDISKPKASKLSNFLFGMLGGTIGGAIVYGVLFLIEHLL